MTAGLVAQSIPWAPMPLESRSPRTPAGEELAGKYAKKRGCCQWVTPGEQVRVEIGQHRVEGLGVLRRDPRESGRDLARLDLRQHRQLADRFQ